MKNKLVNKKVIKALSIGLSVAMTMQPMTAFAAPEEPEEPEKSMTENAKTNADSAKELAAKASNEVNDKAENAIKSVDEAAADVAKTNEDGFFGEDKTSEAAVKEAVEALDTATEDINTKVTGVVENLAEAEKQEDNYQAAEDVAVDAEYDATQAVAGATSVIDKATEDVEAKNEEINAATTIAAAKNSYSEAEAIVKQAHEDFDAAVAEYDSAVEKYDKAVADMDAAQKAYDKAIGDAYADATAAKEDLDEAVAKAAALEEAVKAAQAAMKMQAQAAVAEVEKAANEAGIEDWAKQDELFKSILENYYIPSIGGTFKSAEAHRYDEIDSALDVFEVKYTDETGNVVTKYLTYENTESGELQIFEKSLEFVTSDNAAFDALADKYQIVVADKNGKVVDTIYCDKTADALNKLRADKNMFEVKDAAGNVVGYYMIDAADVNKLPADSEYTAGGDDYNVKSLTEGKAEVVYYTIDANGNLYKNVTKNVTTVTYADKYGANANYINVITDTDSVNETWYTWVAAEIAAAGKEADLKNDHDDDYVISRSGSIDAKNVSFGKYKVSGTVTVKYAEADTLKVDYKTFWAGVVDIIDFLNLFHSDNIEKLEKEVKAKIEAEGGIFVSISGWDWDAKTAKVKYVPASNVRVDEEYATKEEAEEAVKNLAKENANEIKDGIINVTTSSHKEQTDSTNKDVTKNVSVNGYKTSEKAGAWMYKNTNRDNQLLNNDAFNAWKEAAKSYRDLLAEATEAKTALLAAQKKVDDLQKLLTDLTIEKQMSELDYDTLAEELNIKIAAAKENKEKAEKKADELDNKLKKAADDLNNKIKELTPSNGGEGGDDDASYVAGSTAIVGNTILAAAPEARVAAPAVNIGGGAAVAIADDNVALAPAPKKTTEPATTEIADEDTALAPAPIGEESISWWWLLIIAAFGAAGYALYKKSREKKLENTEE